MQSKQAWPIMEVLTAGDRATGTTVLQDLYAEHKETAVHTDLAVLWHDLGVALVDGKIVFNDSARLSKLRRALLQPPP